MRLPTALIAPLLALFLLGCAWPTSAGAQPAPVISDEERAELQLCRVALPKMKAQLEHPQCSVGTAENDPTRRYASAVLDQKLAMGQQAVEALRWQLFASNVVLFLVSLLTISGIALGSYQLVVAARIAERESWRRRGADSIAQPASPDPTSGLLSVTSIELSRDRVSLQTSAIGILVLLCSGFFLYMFLSQVYTIQRIGVDHPDAPVVGQFEISATAFL